MKKSLLFLSLSLFAAGATFAAVPGELETFHRIISDGSGNEKFKSPAFADENQQKLILSKAGEVVDASRFSTMPNPCIVYLAVEFTPEDLAPYIGCTISSVNVTSGCTYDVDMNPSAYPLTSVKVFATEILNEIPEHMTAGELSSDPFAVTSIGLDNPVTITGDKSIYVGYTFVYNDRCFFIPTDFVVTPEDVNNTLVAMTLEEDDVPQYYNYSSSLGSLCISADITGDNLPSNYGKLNAITLNPYFNNGKISYGVTVKNNGINDINSVTVRTEITNGTIYERTVYMPTALKPGEMMAAQVTNVPNEKPGIFDLTAILTRVNGVDVVVPTSQTATYSSYDNGYPRYPVIEEYTGTWCQWCPRGAVMMEFMKERYPDWVRVAVHVNDVMTATSAAALIRNFNPKGNAPLAFTNRTLATSVLGAEEDYYTPIYEDYTQNPAYVNLDFTVLCDEEGKSVSISSVTEFSFDTDVEHLLSFAIVEDNVGPYMQTNGYAGGAIGPMGGWESKPGKVSVTYDDVLRELSSYPGDAGSLPKSVEADTPYTYDLDMSLAKVKGDTFRIIGFVTNAKTGEIVNARQHTWYKDNGAGVEGVKYTPEIVVKAEGGMITVEGATNVAVYTADGRRVGTSNLEPGVYIVNADGYSTRILMRR